MTEITPGMRASFEKSPFPSLLGFRLLELKEGYSKVAVTLRPEYANFNGTPDGALITALADYASATSCSTLGRVMAGIQFSINLVGTPSMQGELVAESRTVHPGRTIVVTEIMVRDGNGKLIAMATGTAITRPPK